MVEVLKVNPQPKVKVFVEDIELHTRDKKQEVLQAVPKGVVQVQKW